MIQDALRNSIALKATLGGVQSQIRSVLGVKRFVLSAHNNPKQSLRALFRSTDYPYGWFKPTNISISDDLANSSQVKRFARFGSGFSAGTTDSSATVKVNHYFPAKINVECEVKTLSYTDALLIIQQLLIASAVDLLNFTVTTSTAFWTVSVKLDSNSLQLPVIDDLDEGSTPGSFNISFPLTISTKIGFHRDTAKINNTGEVTVGLGVEENIDLDIGGL